MVMLAAATAAGDRGPGVTPALPASVSSNPGTASLAPFTLFGWVSPPTEFTAPDRYGELANAGLNTTVLAWQDPGTPDENAKRLEYTRPLGVRNLLLDLRLDDVHEDDPSTFARLDSIVDTYKADPAFLGYYLGDEPDLARFPRLAEWFRLLRARDPSHPGWNNLFGRLVYADRAAFLAYLRAYASQVQPAVLSTDHYDHHVDGDRGLFIDNVSGTAQVAREYGLPFWGIVLLIKHRDYRDVDDGLLRWQVAQWLSYGSRGIGYFTYWTPAPDTNEHWGDGMIRWGTGERAPHYDQVRTLNLRLKPMGETLAGLAWLSTSTAAARRSAARRSPRLAGGSHRRPGHAGHVRGRAGTPYLFVATATRRSRRRSRSNSWASGAWIGSRTPAAGRRGRVNPRRRAVASSWRSAPGDFTLLRVSGGCPGLASGACDATLDARAQPGERERALRRHARAAAGHVHAARPERATDMGATGRRRSARDRVDGHADDGTRVRPGVYWARLTDANGSVVRRVAWLGGR
jgi:hypothetical protein